jgi:molecular chaperone DnaK (HSP70)
MPYVLGIDIGTSNTAAAISRLSGSGWSAAEVVRLGIRSNLASSLYVAADGTIVGGAARDGTGTADGRVVRGFARRIGDDVPLVVGGEPATAQALTAVLVMWVVDRVAAQEGAPAEHIVVSHPAAWGPHRTGLLQEAFWQIGLPHVTLLPEPVAAAEGYAFSEPVEVGAALAVYRLGGTHFEASLVRRTRSGTFELLASAENVEPVGGADFDDALLDQVRDRLGLELDKLDPTDPLARLAMSRLRRDCTAAKEILSAAAEATVAVSLPQRSGDAKLTRAEFEEAIRPALQETVDLLLRAVDSGGLQPEELEAALLTGGSVRIPLVGRLVSAELPCRVAIEPEPEVSVAKGAALTARLLANRPSSAPPYPARMEQGRPAQAEDQFEEYPDDFREDLRDRYPADVPGDELDRLHLDDEFAQPPARPPVELTPLRLPPSSTRRAVRRIRPGLLVVILLVLVALLGVLVTYALGGTVPLRLTSGVPASGAPVERKVGAPFRGEL